MSEYLFVLLNLESLGFIVGSNFFRSINGAKRWTYIKTMVLGLVMINLNTLLWPGIYEIDRCRQGKFNECVYMEIFLISDDQANDGAHPTYLILIRSDNQSVSSRGPSVSRLTINYHQAIKLAQDMASYPTQAKEQYVISDWLTNPPQMIRR